jgi:hypothetical protein
MVVVEVGVMVAVTGAVVDSVGERARVRVVVAVSVGVGVMVTALLI